MRDDEVVSSSVSVTHCSTPQEMASCAMRCANSLATLRSLLVSSLGVRVWGGGGKVGMRFWFWGESWEQGVGVDLLLVLHSGDKKQNQPTHPAKPTRRGKCAPVDDGVLLLERLLKAALVLAPQHAEARPQQAVVADVAAGERMGSWVGDEGGGGGEAQLTEQVGHGLGSECAVGLF